MDWILILKGGQQEGDSLFYKLLPIGPWQAPTVRMHLPVTPCNQRSFTEKHSKLISISSQVDVLEVLLSSVATCMFSMRYCCKVNDAMQSTINYSYVLVQ
ncbi:hypothetical protein AMECASPLE_026948 [Ameca splendens]|uniref:Uncharacterized protein n=1 Tax=Ameca splendens TaxID=208324 RepID=A0ABV1ABE4_9TELE